MSVFSRPTNLKSKTPRRQLPSLSIPTPPTSETAHSAIALTVDTFENTHNSRQNTSITNTTAASIRDDEMQVTEADGTLTGMQVPLDVMSKDVHELNDEQWKQLAKLKLINTIEILGEGNSATVAKCRLKTTGSIFALKTITPDPSPQIQRQILRELNFNKTCQSPFIVRYYGTFFDESTATISICMEYMGGRSLDALYKYFKIHDGRIGEKPLGKVAEGVLNGLSYLNQQRIIHRDIKPQNILLDHEGNVKLCDLGVSGEIVNSLATTFTGTSYYMAPERIKSEAYTITSDVWSLGITLLQGCLGRLPFVSKADAMNEMIELSPVELLQMILHDQLELEDEPEENIVWSDSFKNFLKIALIKESIQRPSPRQMLDHPWIVSQKSKRVRMDKLIQHCWGNLDA